MKAQRDLELCADVTASVLSFSPDPLPWHCLHVGHRVPNQGWGFLKHLASKESCGGDVGKAEGAGSCSWIHWAWSFLQGSCRIWYWQRPTWGPDLLCATKSLLSSASLAERLRCSGFISDVGLMSGWCMDAQAAVEVSPSRGFLLKPPVTAACGSFAKSFGTKKAHHPSWLARPTKPLDVENSSQIGIFEFHGQKYF